MKKSRRFMLLSLITGLLMLSAMFAPVSGSQKPQEETTGTPEGWSDDINLSNHTVQEKYPAIAVDGETIHLVWMYNYIDLGYIKSNDGGKTWDSFTTLYRSNEMVLYPDISVFGQNVHVVWGDIDGWDGIYYCNSTDGGENWNTVKRISPNGIDTGNPHVFANNSNVHIIWHDFRVGTNGQVFYRRSQDGGTTFDNGQGLDEDRQVSFSPADIGGVNMAADGSNISVTWYDERDGDWEIYEMISKDNGFTWENGLGTPDIGRKLTDSSDDSTDPAVAVDGSDIHVIWVNQVWPGPEYYLYYRNSTNNGFTWNPVQLLSGPSPMIASPDITTWADNVHVTWDDARDDSTTTEIYYKNSTDGGITWSSDIRLTNSTGYDSLWPRIAVNGTTKHITWWDLRDGNREIYYKRSPDFPDITAPSHSNEIPLPDSYKDAPGTNISVHVTDPSGVNASTTQLWVNGSLISHTLTPITDGYNVSWVSGGFGPGLVTCQIIAEDMLGNTLDYTWNFTVLALYNIPLMEGWNLISLPLEQVDVSVPNVLASIDGKWEVIKYYDTQDVADPWKSYRPGGTVNDLAGIDNTMGFWIKITEPNVNLTVRGNIPAYTTIPLYAGWNLVGYPTQTTETVGNALWGTGADRVEVFDPVSPYIKEAGATYVMKPGEGYWVHVTADTTWTINW